MPGTAAKVRVSEKQLAVLEELSRSRTVAKGIVQRALILVLGLQGLLNEQIAEEVGLNRQQVGVWRKRWRDAWESLCVWECTEPHRLREAILEVLSDAPRRGVRGKSPPSRSRKSWPWRASRRSCRGVRSPVGPTENCETRWSNAGSWRASRSRRWAAT